MLNKSALCKSDVRTVSSKRIGNEKIRLPKAILRGNFQKRRQPQANVKQELFELRGSLGKEPSEHLLYS